MSRFRKILRLIGENGWERLDIAWNLWYHWFTRVSELGGMEENMKIIGSLCKAVAISPAYHLLFIWVGAPIGAWRTVGAHRWGFTSSLQFFHSLKRTKQINRKGIISWKTWEFSKDTFAGWSQSSLRRRLRFPRFLCAFPFPLPKPTAQARRFRQTAYCATM